MTFICGQAGVYALGAVVAKHCGDEELCKHFLAKFKEVYYVISTYLLALSFSPMLHLISSKDYFIELILFFNSFV